MWFRAYLAAVHAFKGSTGIDVRVDKIIFSLDFRDARFLLYTQLVPVPHPAHLVGR